jgi:predicted DNA-binding protein YlxM (UPF0122 family)
MKKMSVAEAAKFFGVSREAIHNRIRRGSLESVVEDGVKLVLVNERTKPKIASALRKKENKSANDERYYKLLEAQNTKLQERIDILEKETRTLRDQKEQMLIQEREKIEAVYKEKDEQLKNILQTLSSKFMLGAPVAEEPEALEAEISIDEEVLSSSVTSLKKYIKKEQFSSKKAKKIRKRFKKAAKVDDERVLVIGEKFYLDFDKYDYSDLLK